MIKQSRGVTPAQYVAAADNALFTYPNSDWAEWDTVAVSGSRAGSDGQYISSNGALGAGAINLVMFGAGDSNTAYRSRVGVYLVSSLAFVSANTLPTDQPYIFVKVRSGDTLTLYRCPVLSVAPVDASAVTVEGSTPITAAYDGPSGRLVGARGDLNTARFSEQSHGRFGRVNRALTPFEIAKLAYGMRATDMGYTPVFEVGMKDLSDVVDTGPNAIPFTAYGSLTEVADPAYGYTGGTVDPPVPSDSVSVSMTAERVIQRSGSSGVVYPLCNYTNTTPTTIERQLYALDGATVTHAWAAVAGATFANGVVTFGQGITVPAGPKRRIAVRTKNASGVVLATSSISSPFGVGGLDGIIGSSSAEKLFDTTSGSGFPANVNASKFNESGWVALGTTGAGVLWANSMIEQSGMCRGLLDYGIGGTTLAQWLNKSGSQWTAFAAGVAAAGGKLETAYITVGSNDAATAGLVTSREQHAANLRQLIQNVRDLTGQPQLHIVLSGYNRRGRYLTGQTAAGFAIASDHVRMAENDVGNDPFVTHVQTLQFELRTDDLVHLTPNAAGFPACVTLSATVFGRRLYGDGAYQRGPTLGTAVFAGSTIDIPITYRSGTDIVPSAGITGIVGEDKNGGLALNVSRKNANTLAIVADRTIEGPLKLTCFAGGSPDISSAPFDNGAPPMIMSVNSDVPTLDANPGADVVSPTMVGDIAITSVTETSATISWQAATDDVAVTGYEYSINGGTSYVNVNGLRTAALSGLTQNTTYPLRVRAYDAAGNRASPLSANLVTTATPADTTAPALTGAVTSASVTANSATISWPAASDNVAVTGYEYSINGGTSYVNAGTARTASLALLTASTTYPLRVRAYDASGNRSSAITGSLTTLAESPAPVGFIVSTSRTVRILPGRNAYDVGAFWTASGANSPVGSKDPNSTIDIYFDWTAWLADIGNAKLSSVDFILSPGAQSVAGIPTEIGGTVFVSGGTTGQNISITCRITTATTPARAEDRTVILQIKEQ